MYLNPIVRTINVRTAWSLFRHPVRSRDFPAKHERLITAAEMMRYGF